MALAFVAGYPTIRIRNENDHQTHSRSGYPLNTRLVSKDIHLGDTRRMKLVDAVIFDLFDLREPGSITISWGSKKYRNSDLQWDRRWNPDGTSKPRFMRSNGMYFRFMIESYEIGAFYKIQDIVIYGVPNGQRF